MSSLDNFIFELDAKSIVDSFKLNKSDNSRFEALMHNSKSCSFLNFKVKFLEVSK